MTKRHLLLLGLALTGMNSYAAGLAYDFESDSNDWSARGTGETTIELSTEQKHGGEQSLYVDKRSAGWHGALVQNDYIQPGKTYKFSVWVFSKENARIELSLQYTQGEDDSYPAIDSKQVNAYNWTELSGEIVIPEAATNIQPYVQSNENATLSFYIDDFTCEEKVEEIIDYS
ncbi:MAG: carbohydrate binding domain-containing protein, partial [Paludibacteraceae bacterium]|nr:carbohydrate binding domain-containing protein [Paludibacteraceae bacterium]